jgi:hypothetical protein
MASDSRFRVPRVPDVPAVLCVLACLCLCLRLPAQSRDWQTYSDPQKRFTFSFPSAFGIAERSGADGGDRVTAVRFRVMIGMEAVLNKGLVTVERQALGGLYDVFARDILPDAHRPAIIAALAPVTADNFCTLMRRTDHLLKPGGLPEKALQAARATDAMGNVAPKVVVCSRNGATVTFDKEAALGPGSGRRRVYGAIRFLQGTYSAFQVVGFGPAPSEDLLATMTTMVNSFDVVR